MKQIRISDAELVLMEHIWEKEGIRAAQLVQLEKAQMGWSRNTTYTLLTRMVEKEIIRREDPGFCCTALVRVTRQHSYGKSSKEEHLCYVYE